MTDSNEADSDGVSSQGCAGHGHSAVFPGVTGPHEVTGVWERRELMKRRPDHALPSPSTTTGGQGQITILPTPRMGCADSQLPPEK